MRALLALLVVALLGVAALALAGRDSGRADSAYRDAFAAVDARLVTALGDGPYVSGEEQRAQARALDRAAAQLARVEPPRDVGGRHSDFMAALRAHSGELRRAAGEVHQPGTRDAALDASSQRFVRAWLALRQEVASTELR